MQTHGIGLRAAAIAAIAAGSISLPMMSIAQALQRPTLINLHRAGYDYDSRWSERGGYRPPRNPAAYHGHFTLPEFDPNYHGSNGG